MDRNGNALGGRGPASGQGGGPRGHGSERPHVPGGGAPARARASAPRRGLPERSGRRGGVSGRRPRWIPNGVTALIFNALPGESGFERGLAGGAATQARRKAAGTKGGHRGPAGRGVKGVIPYRQSRKEAREPDREMYGWRHRIDGSFAKGREFRAVTTRCDGTEPGWR